MQLDTALAVAGATAELTVTSTTAQELVDRESADAWHDSRPRGASRGCRSTAATYSSSPCSSRASRPGRWRRRHRPAALASESTGTAATENNIQLDGAQQQRGRGRRRDRRHAAPRRGPGVPAADLELRGRVRAQHGLDHQRRDQVAGRTISTATRGIFWRPTFLSAARFFDKDSPSDPAAPRRRRLPPPLRAEGVRRQHRRPDLAAEEGLRPAGFEGRNRAFFFVDYEGRRQLIGDSQTVTGTPSAAERQGDFSA